MKRSQIKQLEPIRFFDFWHLVANELGTSRLRINPSAKTIHEFLDRDSDAREYLQAAIRKSYKLSRCQHLASPISIDCVLDILGETAYALQGDQRDDLFDIELLEEIAWHISNRYLPYLDCEHAAGEVDRSDPTGTGLGKNGPGEGLGKRPGIKGTAQIVSFPYYKIRRANSRL